MTPTKANPYYRPLFTLFRQLVVLNGVLFHLSHHLKTRTVDVEAVLKKFPNRNVLFAGAALIIMDLTEVQPDGYPVMFPVGSHTRRGRRYRTMLDDIAGREAAWTVAQGFEAFEAFCRETALLFVTRNRALLANPAWSVRRGRPSRPASWRVADVRAFLAANFRSANDLQVRLSSSLPRLRNAEVTNHRRVDLARWLTATAAVRHATVHNGRVVSPRQEAKCGPAVFKVLQAAYPGRKTSAGYRLALDQKATENAIEMLGEYAFLIYREASHNESLDPSVFQQMRIRE